MLKEKGKEEDGYLGKEAGLLQQTKGNVKAELMNLSLIYALFDSLCMTKDCRSLSYLPNKSMYTSCNV